MVKIPTVVKAELPFSDLWLTEEGIGVQRRFGGASWRFTSVCFLHIYFLLLSSRLARRRSALCCAFLPGRASAPGRLGPVAIRQERRTETGPTGLDQSQGCRRLQSKAGHDQGANSFS